MGNRIERRLQGIGVLCEDIGTDTLVAIGTAADESAYTQAGPGPGQSVSTDVRTKLVVEVSGGQTRGIDVEIIDAGLPGAEGLRAKLRPTDETADSDWRGRSEPNWPQSWLGVAWSDDEATLDYERFDLVRVPRTEEVIVVYANTDVSTSEPVKSRTFDFTTGDWVAAVDLPTGNSTFDAVSLVALPSGRVLCLVVQAGGTIGDVYATDDSGATWFDYSVDLPSVGSDRPSMAYYRGSILLIGNSSNDAAQLASNSLGTKFDAVELTISNVGTNFSCATIPERGIAVGYMRDADDFPVVKVIGSPFQKFTDADEVVVASAALLDMSITVDDLGVLYVFGRLAIIGNSNRTACWYSVDAGQTWAEVGADNTAGFSDVYSSKDNQSGITNFRSCYARGYHVLAHNMISAPGTVEKSIGAFFLGGWGNLTQSYAFPNSSPRGAAEGYCSDALTTAHTYIPVDLPQDQGWTAAGAGSESLTTPGLLEIVCAAQDRYYSLNPTGNRIVWQGCQRIASGSPGITSLQNGVGLRVANGVYDYRLRVRIGDTTVRVYDGNGASTEIDLTLDGTVFREWYISLNSVGNYEVLYRQPMDEKWTVGATGTVTDGGASAANNLLEVGCTVSTTATVEWRYWFYKSSGAPAVVGAGLGGYLGGYPAPIPGIGSAARCAYIAAERGPGRVAETLTIEPFYEFGVENLFPMVSPSPDTPWRSTAKDTDAEFVFYLDRDGTFLGLTPQQLFAVMNTNFRTMYVEVSNVPTVSGWTSWAEYDAVETGFDGLDYAFRTVAGAAFATLFPASGTAVGPRAIRRNELVGGYVLLGTDLATSSQRARRIVGNSSGVWNFTTASKPLQIHVEGMNGTEPTSGEMEIVWPNGLLHKRLSGNAVGGSTDYAYMRFRIPADQITPDAYYQIGMLFPGTAYVHGKRTSRGWSQAMSPNVARSTSARRTIRKKQIADPSRRWVWNHADGTFLGHTRGNSSPDFLRNGDTTNYPPLALRDDVWLSMWGLLEEIRGGEVPVLALGYIPESDALVQADRSLWLYGTLEGDPQFSHVSGDEGVDEFGRGEPMRVDEIK